MCGIAGLAGERPDRDILFAMGASLAHRGPDDSGTMITPEAGFAFRRLAIIDVAGGNQPIWNEDRSAAIILNGEIYNHRRLRADLEARGHRFTTQTDVEPVLHLWEEEGEGCLCHLEGMFALAIWDARSSSLLLARDRLGKKPLYYHQLAAGGLVFGSEIKALLQHPAVPRRPDLGAIDQFLSLQYVPTPRTAFEGIRRLPPASWLRWSANGIHEGRYWEVDFEPKLDLAPSELQERLLTLLDQAVRDRLESEVPLGVFLSGGIDSSAVVAYAAKAIGRPLQTFSIAFEDRRYDESKHARLVAACFGTEHHELRLSGISADLIEQIVWHHDQPFGDSSAVPAFQLAQVARPHVTVVLTGDGGDESFGGYDRYRTVFAMRHLFATPAGVRRAALTLSKAMGGRGRKFAEVAPETAAEAYGASLIHLPSSRKPELYTAAFRDAAAPPAPLSFLRGLERASLVDGMLETDLHHYLPDDLLVKMDVATMASSVEARSPLLDHRLVEFMAAVPARFKVNHGSGKVLFRRALRGVLPESILNRRKMGFGVPIGRWLRNDLKPMLEEVVLSDKALSRGYFDPLAARRLVRSVLDGNDRDRYVAWDLMMLELWHRTFIDVAPRSRQTASIAR
jgi:asparagine synthase (glutamine-hydrolysing)